TDGSTPAGYALTGTDCAPADATRWQELAYSYVDNDGDGYTVGLSGQVCAGATLPKPYATVANGNDCNDADPSLYRYVVLYTDADGDGVGTMPRQIPCLGATLPAGWSIYGDDVDDTDPTQQLDDTDIDDLLAIIF
ncbi:MAG TPA: hypothetical protein VHB97_12910, partial [Polyangia bacterium]|nr:hypothetical protein [Polyangia bacterium]